MLFILIAAEFDPELQAMTWRIAASC